MAKGNKSEEAEDAPMLPKIKRSTSTGVLNGQGQSAMHSSRSALNLQSGGSPLYPSRRPSQTGVAGTSGRDPEVGIRPSSLLFTVHSDLDDEIDLGPGPSGRGQAGGHIAAQAAALREELAEPFGAQLWRYFFYFHVIGPWKFIRGLGWLLNKWQRLFRPISIASYFVGDGMDKHMPTIHSVFIWAWNTTSLLLHFLSVFTTWSVASILWHHGHRNYSVAIWCLYGISHYLMAVIMYMEMDRVVKSGRYNLSEWWSFLVRLVQVAFWDIQMLASTVHSNLMIEGLTQMLLKGYEEARVCIHAIVNTIPMCIMLGVLYDFATLRWIKFQDIDIRSYNQQIWAALALSVVNALEKAGRCALADPWLHPRNNDRYPLLYMRSNAARLPRGLVLDWLFRCNAQLASQEEELILRNVYSVYTFNCKGDVRELCDGHKAILLKKALRTFNGANKYNRAEVLARRLDKAKFRRSHSIRALDASRINPGRYMSGMLAQVLADSNGFDSLNLADNLLGDTAVIEISDALRTNEVLELSALVLSGNEIGQYGCEALASLLASAKALQLLVLSQNPIEDAGARALAGALTSYKLLTRLDLSGSRLGPDAGAALGAMLKTNTGLRELDVSGSSLGTLGVDSLSKGLRVNAALKDLRVSRVGSEDKGAVCMAQALTANRTLTRLDLSRNPAITDVGAKALTDALQGNNVLQVCDLTATSVSPSWIKLMTNVITMREAGQAGQQPAQAGQAGSRAEGKGRGR